MKEREVLYSSLLPSEVETDVLVVGAFEDGLEEEASRLDALLGGMLEEVRREEMKGEVGETAFLRLRGAEGARASRVCLVGLGKRDKLSPETLRRAAGGAARASRERGGRRVALALPAAGEEALSRIRAITEGAVLGLYRFPGYRSKPEEKEVERLVILGPGEGREAFEKGLLLARCTSLARDLTNEPSNRLTPEIFARRAEEEARKAGLEVEIWDEKRCEEEGMGAFLGVARGSHEPPRFVQLRYRAGDDLPTLALVGKGITFDSGGISIKPSEGMDEMKMDMAGAAAVLGALLAVSHLRPRLNVWGLMPLTENLPGGRAQKPGDVVRACNGKTIEVANTDAEGRLILADAVAWAVKGGARWVVDIATLTGAVVIALGHQAAALLGNDEGLVEKVRRAGEEAGERLWVLPSYPEYREQYKSQVADLKNVGGRPAGTITGALFIGEFAGDTPWAHLDIAGVAWHDQDLPYQPKGASGFGVRTLALLAENLP